MKPGSNLLAIAAVFTVVVTFYSLSELHKLSSATQLSDSRLAAHADWKTIAERAVLHVEELPLKFAHGHAQHGHPIAGERNQGPA